jgi:oxepin-CoA hydrolase/3-oxo-5,6-dehydrosuberyl-CoA semialdehyde dehydrogenase
MSRIMKLTSYALGRWVAPSPDAVAVASAVTGEVVAEAAGGRIDMGAVLAYARDTGGPALRNQTFHQRADLVKRLAADLNERKEILYRLSVHTGATRTDAMIDVDGGIGTMFALASKGRRELPSSRVLVDGSSEPLGKDGTFAGQHILTPRQGTAVQGSPAMIARISGA